VEKGCIKIKIKKYFFYCVYLPLFIIKRGIGYIFSTLFTSSHIRTVARKFSIGGFAVLQWGFAFCVCVGWLDIIKLTKTPFIYSVSRSNLGGLELCLGGLAHQSPLWRRDFHTCVNDICTDRHPFFTLYLCKLI